MRLERTPDGLVWSLPTARARAAQWVRGLAVIFAIGSALAGTWALAHWPSEPAAPAACPETVCPVRRPSIREREASRDAFLAKARCVVDFWEVPRQPMLPAVADSIGRSTRSCEARAAHPHEAARVRWLVAGWERWYATTLERDRVLLVSALHQAEIDAQLQRIRDARSRTTGAGMGLLLAVLGFGLGTWLGRPLRVRFDRTGLTVGRRHTAYRWLRGAEVRDGRLVVRDIEGREAKSPVLAAPEPLARVLPALLEQVRDGDLADAELDALEHTLAAVVPDYTTHLGGVPIRWTVQGAEADLVPRGARLWAVTRQGAAITAFAAGAGLLYAVTTPSPAVYGAYSAEACAAGEPACLAAAPDDPALSLHAYAARRMCTLVDRPIRESSYDDALRNAEAAWQAARFAASGGAGLEALVDAVRDEAPCRDGDWRLGEGWGPTRTLWRNGPRNKNVWRTQIPLIEAGAEAIVREEWALLEAASVPAWEAALDRARQRLLLVSAGLLALVLLASAVLRRARWRSEPCRLAIAGPRIAIDGRSVALEQVRGVGVEDGSLVIELDGGERIGSVPLESPGDADVFATWIRERLTEPADAPPDVERLRALAANGTRGTLPA